MTLWTEHGKPVPHPDGEIPPMCPYCAHNEPADLAWSDDFWACRDTTWCDFRAVDRGLWRGEHLDGQ